MPDTLTIRLSPEDRATLASAATDRGEGLSTFVRGLAEAEARRVRHAAIREEIERFTTIAAGDVALSREAAPPDADWPAWDESLPAAWAEALGG